MAKTGGLADMLSAYAASLSEAGIRATILMPAYPAALAHAVGPREVGVLPGLPGGEAALLSARMPDTGVPVLLLRNDALYARAGLYQDPATGREWDDNAVRFAALAAAAAQVAAGVPGVAPVDVVHAHDWHAGLTPLYMKMAKLATKCVFTIHNLAFQGNYALEFGPALGIPAYYLTPGPHAPGIEFYGQMSFMKAGVRFADKLTTVSQTYAREILTPRFGHLMEGVLQENAYKLCGVINGIDLNMWNPRTDPLIARPFGLDDLRGKHACKRELQQVFGLPSDPFVPVLALGSRLTWQKMVDLATDAIPVLLQAYPRLQVAVLGQGEAGAEQAMTRLAQRFPNRVGVHIGYDEKRAHVLHAGADILLHGSRFEPCGLTPMYTMRYGTIPVASRVGGLADSIVDENDVALQSLRAMRQAQVANALTQPLAQSTARPNGFLFDGETVEALSSAVSRALEAFMRPASWRALQRNAMSSDFSWQAPVASYLALYSELAGTRLPVLVRRTRAVRAVRAVEAAEPVVRRPLPREQRRSA